MAQSGEADAVPQREPRRTYLGVGLQRSRDDAEWHMGHMWLYWPGDSGVPKVVEYRGYYPKLNHIPKRLRHDKQALKQYLIECAVPGQYLRDVPPAHPIRERTWDTADAQVSDLADACYLPPGKDEKDDGMYSCNEALPDTHNCSSWAIEKLNKAAGVDLISCDRPKRLAVVESRIWPHGASSA